MRDTETADQTPDIPRGRPRKFNEDEVMIALLDLFWDQGYEGASLNDIMQATGLKKGSLYSLFGGKRDMYLKALTQYDRDYVAAVCKMLADKGAGTADKRLDQFLSLPIDAVYKGGDQRGCFLCNASAEMAAHDPEVRNFISSCYKDMTDALEAAIKESRPHEDAQKAAAQSRVLMTVYSGLRIMSRSQLSRDYMEAAKEAALDF